MFEGPIRHALHKLKYRRNVTLGDALAGHLNGYVRQLGWPIDLVIPVPLGRQRMKERGYNQIGLVALPMAVMSNWSYSSRALVRARETRSQVGLTAAERKTNVSGAFSADSRCVSGRTILLMDDVATTGATLSAAASALLDGGARAVYGLTIARALPHHGLQQV